MYKNMWFIYVGIDMDNVTFYIYTDTCHVFHNPLPPPPHTLSPSSPFSPFLSLFHRSTWTDSCLRHEFAAADVLVPFHSRLTTEAPTSTATSTASVSNKEDTIDAKEEDEGSRVKRLKGASDRGEVDEAESDVDGDMLQGGGGGGGGGSVTMMKEKVIVDEVTGGEIKHNAIVEAKSSIVYQRYCHVFASGELTSIVASLNSKAAAVPSWCEVEKEYYDTGNWCIIVRKLGEMPDRLFV